MRTIVYIVISCNVYAPLRPQLYCYAMFVFTRYIVHNLSRNANRMRMYTEMTQCRDEDEGDCRRMGSGLCQYDAKARADYHSFFFSVRDLIESYRSCSANVVSHATRCEPCAYSAIATREEPERPLKHVRFNREKHK